MLGGGEESNGGGEQSRVYGQPEVSAHLRTRTRDVDVLIGRCVFGPKGSNVLARSTGELHSLLRQADPALGRAR